jgi:hypothetical protein
MKECFDSCGGEDWMTHEGIKKLKKKDINRYYFTWEQMNSDRWQIKRAEPKVLSADECLKECYGGMEKNFGCSAMQHMFDRGDENGQLKEWSRPEQVSLRETLKELFSIPYYGEKPEALMAAMEALNNLKPPYEQKNE